MLVAHVFPSGSKTEYVQEASPEEEVQLILQCSECTASLIPRFETGLVNKNIWVQQKRSSPGTKSPGTSSPGTSSPNVVYSNSKKQIRFFAKSVHFIQKPRTNYAPYLHTTPLPKVPRPTADCNFIYFAVVSISERRPR
jgi:hypothetical protein